jgi:L-amino acid N-acyltransferase YncA
VFPIRRPVWVTRVAAWLPPASPAANEPTLRCYAKVGFRPVGVLRQHERGDGRLHDGLLMDLFRDELAQDP